MDCTNIYECVTYRGRYWFYNIALPHHVGKWQSHDTTYSPTGNEQKNSSVAAALSDPAYQMVWIPTFCHTLNIYYLLSNLFSICPYL